MIARELMNRNVVLVSPHKTVNETAALMKEIDSGFLPVGVDLKNIIGVITDRDIVVRAISEGLNPKLTNIRDIMSREVITCNELDDLPQIVSLMRENKTNRLIVHDHNEWVTGVITYGHIVRNAQSEEDLHKIIESTVPELAAIA